MFVICVITTRFLCRSTYYNNNSLFFVFVFIWKYISNIYISRLEWDAVEITEIVRQINAHPGQVHQVDNNNKTKRKKKTKEEVEVIIFLNNHHHNRDGEKCTKEERELIMIEDLTPVIYPIGLIIIIIIFFFFFFFFK